MCIIKIRCSANFNTNGSIEAELRSVCKHRKISENGFLGSNFDRGVGDGEISSFKANQKSNAVLKIRYLVVGDRATF
jgi:hypothetical protein